MHITENKYHSTIKVEFRDLVSSIVNSERSLFHVYTIHRLLSLGLLIDFTFMYQKTDDPNGGITIELDLKEHGKAYFKINAETNYSSLSDERSMQVLKDFLENYSTKLTDGSQKGTKLFDK